MVNEASVTRSRFSSYARERYRRGGTLGRLRYGVVSGRESGSRNRHVYGRSRRRSRRGVGRRRTKVEGGSYESTRRRSGKRVQSYTSEVRKGRRRRTTVGTRRVSKNYVKEGGLRAYEYPLLRRLSTVGLRMLVNANDRIGRYVSIEWVSLCLYVRAAFRRGSAYSTEAGLKYYVVGAFGSAWMLFGIALVYGWRGTLNRVEIERRRRRQEGTAGRFGPGIGWILMRGAFILKRAGVPRHRWLADVYEGAPVSSVYYFSVVPKVGVVFVRRRRVDVWYSQSTPSGETTSLVMGMRRGIAIRSMAVGSIGAVGQRRRKRFRAYSAIGHSGYRRLGLLTDTVEGVQGLRVYLIVYVLMTMRMWNRIRIVKRYEFPYRGKRHRVGVKFREAKYRTDRSQLSRASPVRGGVGVVTRMSMAGVPPRAGFGAKRRVLSSMITLSMYFYIAVVVLLSVVGAFNYVRIVKRMYFEEMENGMKEEEFERGMSKEVSRRRMMQTGLRRLLRIYPSSLLLLTHRMAVQIVS